MFNTLIITLILASFSYATSPPILNRPLASQIIPDNPAISSAFLVLPSSALLPNTSISPPALRVPPSWSFSIGFLGDTFLSAQSDSPKLSFDAQLDTGNPLPDWMEFAPDTITFGGVAPRESHTVQVLNIVVTATSSASLSTSDKFTLIVSLHDLSLTGPLLTRNVTAGTKFSFIVDDWQGVQVDGARVTMADSASPHLALALNTASYLWLSYDAISRTLTGTPPDSYAGVPGPSIPALVTLTFPTQSFTIPTNLTLDVFPSAFTMKNFPAILAPVGKTVVFNLSPFLSSGASPTLVLNAKWDTQNATWLNFDQSAKTLTGNVPAGAAPTVEVLFTAHDTTRGTESRAEMLLKTETGDGGVRSPTDRALRKTAKRVSLAVGIVCGSIAAIILFASFLALCRRFCTAHEHVDGPYVIDQSAFDEGLKGGDPYEKEGGSDSTSPYFTQASRVALGAVSPESRMITKAAFFNAVRERFGNEGSWRGGRTPNSSLGSGKRARKSKISKPMAMLSSSTSVHDGFADRAHGKQKNAPFYSGGNFTIFGSRNNAHGSVMSNSSPSNSPDSSTGPPRPPHADVIPSHGRALLSPGSSTGTPVLAYDRSRSSSDPSKNFESAGGGSPSAPRSGSTPSMAIGSRSSGTQTGTQSTFATGDSTRLTNAVGEVPFRRPGFDGRRETLAERNMREMGSANADRSTRPILSSRAVTKAGDTISPAPKTLTAATPAMLSPAKDPLKAALKNDRPPKPLTPPKSATLLKPSKSRTPPKADAGSNTNSPRNLATSPSKSGTAGVTSKPISEGGDPAPSTFRNVFVGDKDNDSDGMESGADDVENAVIRHAVQRTSSETMVKQGPAGKPRLVAFTHERTPAALGQVPRRDVSQKVVVQGSEESDPEAEMRIGLEYVRQLGYPEAKQEVLRVNTKPPSISASRVSLASKKTDPPVAFYASNDSNGSIAGRTRVMTHLVINSHRHRHQTAYSTESTHDSFVSSGAEGESRWAVETELPHVILGPGEPFNFAASIDRAHKHASALAGSALEAKQADGRALPEWLRFRNIEREFWGVSPMATNGETGAMLVARVVVHIWDAEKSEVVGGCLIDVLANE